MQAGATRLRLSRLPLVLHFTSSKLLDVGPLASCILQLRINANLKLTKDTQNGIGFISGRKVSIRDGHEERQTNSQYWLNTVICMLVCDHSEASR
jgi:hypothetical protein